MELIGIQCGSCKEIITYKQAEEVYSKSHSYKECSCKETFIDKSPDSDLYRCRNSNYDYIYLDINPDKERFVQQREEYSKRISNE